MRRSYLFLTQTFPRFAEDTAGPFIREIALGLQRLGDRVTVLVPHTRGLARVWDDRGLEVRSFRYAPAALERIGYGRSLESDEQLRLLAALGGPLYLLGAAAALRREVRRRRYDLVHAHWLVPNAWSAWLRGLFQAPFGRRSPPFAIGLHGSDVFLAEKPLARSLSARVVSSCVLLTGCSPELVERVLAIAGKDSRRILSDVIPYGVDVETFSPSRQEGADGGWRRSLGIPDDGVVVLGVGRMATKKGFHVLAEALPRLLARHPRLWAVLAGGGDREAQLRAATASCRERVLFPGSVPRDTLPDLYRAADIFVLPAVHDAKGNVDGLPNVILEAMASGLPVVASAISGIPLAIESGRHGVLVGEGDREALAAALSSLIEDPSLRLRLGCAARERATAELTWDHVARRYRAAYDRALGASPG